MFSSKIKTDADLDPYFRIIYSMEVIAVIAVVAGSFLVWWDGPDPQTIWDLLASSLDEFADREPTALFQPLVVLWFLLPVVPIAALRGVTGIVVQPVWYRPVALAAWGAAMLALAHFYINYGDELAANSPLKDGNIGPGFWLTASSMAILGLLVLVEGMIKPPEIVFVGQDGPAQPVEDAEALWRGDYQTCPYCGVLNEPKARTCYNCRNLLFNFDPDKQ